MTCNRHRSAGSQTWSWSYQSTTAYGTVHGRNRVARGRPNLDRSVGQRCFRPPDSIFSRRSFRPRRAAMPRCMQCSAVIYPPPATRGLTIPKGIVSSLRPRTLLPTSSLFSLRIIRYFFSSAHPPHLTANRHSYLEIHYFVPTLVPSRLSFFFVFLEPRASGSVGRLFPPKSRSANRAPLRFVNCRFRPSSLPFTLGRPSSLNPPLLRSFSPVLPSVSKHSSFLLFTYPRSTWAQHCLI